MIRFLRRTRGLSPDQIARLTDAQLAAELEPDHPVASAAEVAAANASGAAKGMAKAIAMLDRIAKANGVSPAYLAIAPLHQIAEACRADGGQDAARVTVAALPPVLAAYRRHHNLPAAAGD